MSVRARVWSTRGATVNVIINGVHYRRYTHRTWHYEVYNSRGQVVLYDNTGYWRPILQDALVRVEALRHMETAGHTLDPYREDT